MEEQSSSTNPQRSFTRKKRKLTIETEPLTLTLIPDHTHTSNHKQKQGRGNSENRKWVYSTRDCSNHKGSTIYLYALWIKFVFLFVLNSCNRVADKFVFVSYNILGVGNASKHKDLYINVPPKFLKWKHRLRVIRKEIARYNPSVLCLQASFHCLSS